LVHVAQALMRARGRAGGGCASTIRLQPAVQVACCVSFQTHYGLQHCSADESDQRYPVWHTPVTKVRRVNAATTARNASFSTSHLSPGLVVSSNSPTLLHAGQDPARPSAIRPNPRRCANLACSKGIAAIQQHHDHFGTTHPHTHTHHEFSSFSLNFAFLRTHCGVNFSRIRITTLSITEDARATRDRINGESRASGPVSNALPRPSIWLSGSGSSSRIGAALTPRPLQQAWPGWHTVRPASSSTVTSGLPARVVEAALSAASTSGCSTTAGLAIPRRLGRDRIGSQGQGPNCLVNTRLAADPRPCIACQNLPA